MSVESQSPILSLFKSKTIVISIVFILFILIFRKEISHQLFKADEFNIEVLGISLAVNEDKRDVLEKAQSSYESQKDSLNTQIDSLRVLIIQIAQSNQDLAEQFSNCDNTKEKTGEISQSIRNLSLLNAKIDRRARVLSNTAIITIPKQKLDNNEN